jgi:CHAT domain-containing protein/Tfp pilus assembly protein PilF
MACVFALMLFVGAEQSHGQNYPPLTDAQEKAMLQVTELLKQANKLEDEGNYEAAEAILKQSLAQAERIGGPEHVAVTFSLNNLGDLYKQLGDYEQAEQYHLRALAIREKVLGPAHRDIVFSLSNLGEIYTSKGDYTRGEVFAQRALTMCEKLFGPDDPLVAMPLNNLAVTYQERGDNARAEPLFRRVLAIREKSLGPDHPDVAVPLNNLAHLYVANGEYEKVEPLLQRALRIYEKAYGPDNLRNATLLNNTAEFYREMGEYAKAEPLYQRAIRLIEATGGPDSVQLATTLNNLCVLYQSKGDYEHAEPLARRAIAIVEKSLGADAPAMATLLANLGSIYQANGDYDRAEQTYQRALTVAETAFGKEHPNVAIILKNLGDLYQLKEDYARAIQTYERALQVWQKAVAPDSPQAAPALNNLAMLYMRKGDFTRAEPLYRRALVIQEKSFGSNHPGVARTLSNLGIVAAAQGDVPKALSFFTRSNDIHERNLTLMLTTGSEEQKLLYAASFATETEGAVSLHFRVAPANADAARLGLLSILRHKGRVLDATSEQIDTLRRHLDAQGLKLLEQLSGVRSRLATLVLTGAGDKDPAQYQREVARLETEGQRLEAEISSRSSEFRARSQPVTLARVQQLIPMGAALVEIMLYEPMDLRDMKNFGTVEPMRYVAYVLSREGEPLWADLGEATAIDNEIVRLRDALRDQERTDVKQIARAVDDKVMRPIRKLLPAETRTLLLSPDGALNLIPFSALVDEKNRYLVENYSFIYLTSGRDLLRLEAQTPSRQPGLIIANPKFDESIKLPGGGGQTAGTEQSAPQSRSFDFSKAKFLPLPGTAGEAQALSTILPSAKILTETQATETALKKITGPKILHIATHGFFLPDEKQERAKERGVSRQLEMEKGGGRKPVVIENPLLRSGLALAGANLRQGGNGEDGVLTAMEAAGLDLWGTKLVVLSACETGVGEVRSGQGVYGLRRALVIAGAESQLMSLWPISDLATRDLMIAYYKRLKAGEGRSEALRQVQLGLLKDRERSHPFYWASFIQLGDWRPIDFSAIAPQ